MKPGSSPTRCPDRGSGRRHPRRLYRSATGRMERSFGLMLESSFDETGRLYAGLPKTRIIARRMAPLGPPSRLRLGEGLSEFVARGFTEVLRIYDTEPTSAVWDWVSFIGDMVPRKSWSVTVFVVESNATLPASLPWCSVPAVEAMTWISASRWSLLRRAIERIVPDGDQVHATSDAPGGCRHHQRLRSREISGSSRTERLLVAAG